MSNNMLIRVTLTSFFLAIFFSGCGSSSGTSVTKESNPRQVEASHELTLLQLIQQLSGVTVRGSDTNAEIIVMVGNRFQMSSASPLFLLNGIAYSNDFQSIQNSINVFDVRSVEVYKTPSELSLYGIRGANGVINIIMK